jgi:hypothetical protein
MSNPSPLRNESRFRGLVSAATLDRLKRLLAAPVRFVSFWVAVALPFLYVPLLWSGLGAEEAVVFVTLLCANVVALVVGHGHRRSERRG